MNVSELKEILNQYDDKTEIFITNDSYGSFVFPIENIEERNTFDNDESTILVIKY